MKTKEFILNRVQKKGSITTKAIVEHCGIRRQTAHQHLRELVMAGKIMKKGSTINARYVPFSRATDTKKRSVNTIVLRKSTTGLEEDRLFSELSLRLNLQKHLSKCAYVIIQYAFTEMVNNVIDHSKASTVYVKMSVNETRASFVVGDKGVGAFNSIRKRFRLKDNYVALEHLMKGKQTTDPKKHSGQGLFFTSRSADLFYVKSSHLRWIVDNTIKETFVEELKKTCHGTSVYFEIKKRSRKKLEALFKEYSNDNYEFDKTCVTVHLSPTDGMYVSRSEAKRLVMGLDKFERIVFDFKKVASIGQGFADEVFRLFVQNHRFITVDAINMSRPVAFMINRAKKG